MTNDNRILHLLIGAFLFRIIVLVFIVATLGSTVLITNDSKNFLQAGINIVNGNGVSLDTIAPFHPSAHFPPLYPLIIAISLKIFGTFLPVIVLQLFISVCTAYLVWLISLRLLNTDAARLVSTALAAFEPLSFLWGLLLLTEVFAVFFLVLSIYFVIRFSEGSSWAPVLAGYALALSALTRPHAYLLYICITASIIGYTLLTSRFDKHIFRKIFLPSISFLAAFFLVLSPWLYRNYQLFGDATLSTTGLRNIYTAVAPAVLSLHTGKDFETVKTELRESFMSTYHATEDDIQENPAFSDELATEGFHIMRAHPKETAQVFLIAINAFFTQDLSISYLYRFHLIPNLMIDFSPSVVLLTEGPVVAAKRIWDVAGLYALIPITARMFWICINILWITGFVVLFHKGGKVRLYAIGCVGIILFYALTSSVAAFSDHGRFRYPASMFMFILAGMGYEYVSSKIRSRQLFAHKFN